MTSVAITSARPADAAALAQIQGDWVRETPWMPVLHGRDEDLAFMAGMIRKGSVLVAREGAHVLGFLARDGIWIVSLYLVPEARGKGVGKALIDAVKSVEPELGLWAFQANSRAVRFYRREGFVEVERTDGSGNEEGLPDICMVWRAAT